MNSLLDFNRKQAVNVNYKDDENAAAIPSKENTNDYYSNLNYASRGCLIAVEDKYSNPGFLLLDIKK